MDGTKAGQALVDLEKITGPVSEKSENGIAFVRGGNAGTALIAQSIERLADALVAYSSAMLALARPPSPPTPPSEIADMTRAVEVLTAACQQAPSTKNYEALQCAAKGLSVKISQDIYVSVPATGTIEDLKKELGIKP